MVFSKDKILATVDQLSISKNIQKETVFEAIESALISAAYKQLKIKNHKGVEKELEQSKDSKEQDKNEVELEVKVDRQKGDFKIYKIFTKNNKEVREEVKIKSQDFSRLAAQAAKQTLLHKIKIAEREKVIEGYKDKIGRIVTGMIYRRMKNYFVVKLNGGVFAIINKNKFIAGDNTSIGESIIAFISHVQRDDNGPMLVLSRVDNEMLIALFKKEIPEVDEDIIEIKSVAREPGIRAKVAVKTNDRRIDPVGVCVGMRGSRVNNISSAINNERIDIVLWDENPAQFIINAMTPAEIISLKIDEENNRSILGVAEENLSMAIGRNGQNVSLASRLTGWYLDVVDNRKLESPEKVANAKDNNNNKENLIDELENQLDIDRDFSEILIEGGVTGIKSLAKMSTDDIMQINENINEELAKELLERARTSEES